MRGVPAALGGRKGLRLQGFAALKRYGKFLLMREKEKNMRQIDTVALIGLGAMGAYFAPIAPRPINATVSICLIFFSFSLISKNFPYLFSAGIFLWLIQKSAVSLRIW